MRALLLILLLPSIARANPLDAFGWGARGPAMGGAQTAAVEDGGANFYNPAALARARTIQVDVAYQLAAPFLSINHGDQDVDGSRGLALALVTPGQVHGVDIALGAGIFLPDQRLTRTRSLATTVPRWSLYDNRPQRVFLGANLAIRLHEDVWIGGGLAYLSRTEGTLDLTGRIGFPDGDDSELALDIDIDLRTVRYPLAGVLWRAQPWLDLGLSYRGEFVLSLEQEFTIRGDVGAAGLDPIVEDGYFRLRSVALDLFQPGTFTFGFAARLTSRLLLAGDVGWERWSRYENPSAKIHLELDIGELNDLVDLPEQRPLPRAFFHDIVVPRIGLEWLATRSEHATVRLRAGYAYAPSPAPEQIGETNFVDNDKHTVSLGAGVALSKISGALLQPFDLDVYVAGTFLPRREHEKLSPVDPVGDFVSQGFVLQLGVGSRWRF